MQRKWAVIGVLFQTDIGTGSWNLFLSQTASVPITTTIPRFKLNHPQTLDRIPKTHLKERVQQTVRRLRICGYYEYGMLRTSFPELKGSPFLIRVSISLNLQCFSNTRTTPWCPRTTLDKIRQADGKEDLRRNSHQELKPMSRAAKDFARRTDSANFPRRNICQYSAEPVRATTYSAVRRKTPDKKKKKISHRTKLPGEERCRRCGLAF